MSVPVASGNLHRGLDEALEHEQRVSGIWRDTGRNILRQRNAIIGMIILAFMLLVAIFADQLSTYPPNDVLLGVVPGAAKRPRRASTCSAVRRASPSS